MNNYFTHFLATPASPVKFRLSEPFAIVSCLIGGVFVPAVLNLACESRYALTAQGSDLLDYHPGLAAAFEPVSVNLAASGAITGLVVVTNGELPPSVQVDQLPDGVTLFSLDDRYPRTALDGTVLSGRQFFSYRLDGVEIAKSGSWTGPTAPAMAVGDTLSVLLVAGWHFV